MSICLSVHLSYLHRCHHVPKSICPYVCLSICLSVKMSICLYVYLFVCLYVCVSIGLSVCLSVHLSHLHRRNHIPKSIWSICLSVHISFCLFICQNVHLSVCPNVYQSFCPYVCLSIYISVHLSIGLTCIGVIMSQSPSDPMTRNLSLGVRRWYVTSSRTKFLNFPMLLNIFPQFQIFSHGFK